ncbi:ADR069Cp [Eremothecium gossypii ATCC 10895]|uniref:ADR069Cp n=1 Tax=Eremothecium gossypii (strain ATCC 10895 / CBS 109.51 / FGSC 9923 / NRRL Y-1056) TaxID=284811 RepID=Q75A50_EREGS|nr:ADR069Cp [Eremothecium gossypii ATCC 10895]AAS51989.1 ADR069Cp [Eremothecium gossypii ATCC 10895]AEY96289.1 FADR069Cp [Eremothecium gossypii FDAG1]
MKTRNSAKGVSSEDPYGANEVDDFAAKREKVMLEEAGLDGRSDSDDSDVPDEQEDEVMAMTDDSSDEDSALDGEEAYKRVFGRRLDADIEEAEQGDMLDNEAAWGSTKNDYYGADDLDDEDAAREIEKEALQQQRKHLEELNMGDFLEDEIEQDWVKEAKAFDIGEFQASTQQTSVSVADVLNMSIEGKESFLNTSFPEFYPLCKDFEKRNAELELLKEDDQTEVNRLRIMALSSYLGTIASYFAIFLHELKTNEDFSTMKDHPIMESILMSREMWRQAKELPADAVVPEGEEQVSEDEEEPNSVYEYEAPMEESGDEQEQDMSAESAEGDSDVQEELDIDVSKPRIKKSHKKAATQDADDFAESEITEVDAQEKQKRRKTLRFYTSKIDQKANKTEKFKGDDDIPYKERLFERQQRLLEEARKRGVHDKNGADLQNDEFNSDDERTAQSVNAEAVDDYYAQVSASRVAKKETRMKAHKDALRAVREGKLSELAEEVDEHGKRAINYQILKNKGLTPKRKKDNRNSRVKKRKKFEKAQKKLKSVRAVYSGGQNGAYEGEQTGIRKNVTKSVKFRS